MATLKESVKKSISSSATKNGMTVVFGEDSFVFYDADGKIVSKCANSVVSSVVSKEDKEAEPSDDDARLF